MFSDALEEMSRGVTNIICIAQITFEFVNNAMLVNEGRFGLNHFDILNHFPAGKHWVQIISNFLAKIAEISSQSVGRSLIF